MKGLPQSFPKPLGDKRPDLLLIAGEHSGDAHAAKLVLALGKIQPKWSIYALGGPKLKAAGSELLWDLSTTSVVGLVEVLRHYRYFKKLFQLTLEWIRAYQPRALCFVDYPGFNLRLARALYQEGLAAKAGGPIRLLYYIGPQVWAWKAKRRFAMAQYFDALGVIFPFEVASYKDTALQVDFVGHPFMEEDYEPSLAYHPAGPIALLPGSRKGAVRRIFPLLLEAFSLYKKKHPDARALVIVPSSEIEAIIRQVLEDFPGLKSDVLLRYHGENTFASAALVSSGTMSLACAFAGIPLCIVYKANILTYWMGRMLVKLKYLGMVNILLNRLVCKEYLQGAAKPVALAKELETLSKPKAALKAEDIAQKIKKHLTQAKVKSTAEWLIATLEG